MIRTVNDPLDTRWIVLHHQLVPIVDIPRSYCSAAKFYQCYGLCMIDTPNLLDGCSEVDILEK